MRHPAIWYVDRVVLVLIVVAVVVFLVNNPAVVDDLIKGRI